MSKAEFHRGLILQSLEARRVPPAELVRSKPSQSPLQVEITINVFFLKPTLAEPNPRLDASYDLLTKNRAVWTVMG